MKDYDYTSLASDNDWMGERFIRGQRYSTPEADVHTKETVRKDWGTCSHEGCDRRLGYRNKTGRCVHHRTGTCKHKGCKVSLDFRNTSGFCYNHSRAKGAT